MLPTKKIKAPKYFLEIRSSTEEYLTELSDMLNVSIDWIIESMHTEALSNHIKNLKLSEDKLQKIKLLLKIIGDISMVAWDRFRIENIGNEFGEAEHLNFDHTKKIIVIVKSPLDYIKDAIFRFKKENPKAEASIEIEDK